MLRNHSTGNRRIATNTVSLYVRMAVVLLLTLFTTRVVLKSLGAEDYGIYNVVCGFVSLFSFLNGSLSLSINRFFNYALGEEDGSGVTKVFNTSIRIQVLIAIILFLFIEIIGGWYINEKLVVPTEKLLTAKWIFQFAVISLVLTLLQTPFMAAVLAYERMQFYAVISVLDAVLKLIIAYLIQISSDNRLFVYGCLMLSISVLNLVAYALFTRIKFKTIRLSKRYDSSLFKSMLSFSGWSMLNPIAFTARSQGCNVLLNYFGGPIVNAAYTLANQVASALDSFSVSISVAFRPQLIQSYSSNSFSRTYSLCTMMSKIMYAMILMLFIPLFLETSCILNIWLGDNIPQYTIRFTFLVLIVKLIDSLNPAITNTIMATGTIRQYMIWSSVIISMVLPLSYFAMKQGSSPDIVFVLMVFLTVLNQLVSVFILSKAFPLLSFSKYLKDVIYPCLLQTIIVVPIPAIVHNMTIAPLFRLICISGASLVFSIIGGYLFLLSRSDRKRATSFLRSMLHIN